MEQVLIPTLRNALMLAFIEEARTTGYRVFLTLNARRLNDPLLVPHFQDGTLTLNIAMRATPNYEAEPEFMIFHSSFSGKRAQVFAYYDDVLAIMAFDENNQPKALYHVTDEHQVTIQMEGINASAFAALEANAEPTQPPVKERPKLSVVK